MLSLEFRERHGTNEELDQSPYEFDSACLFHSKRLWMKKLEEARGSSDSPP